MATRLGGPVEVEVTLDTKRAEAKLDQLEGKLRQTKTKADQVNKTAGLEKVREIGGAGRGLGTGAREREEGKKSATERLLDAVRKTGITRQTFATEAPVEAAPTVRGAVAGMAKAAAVVTAGYLATSTAAQLSPAVLAGIKELSPQAVADSPVFKGLETAVHSLSESFSTFEAGVKAMFSATTQTAQVVSAGALLTGNIPNIPYYWDMNHKAESQEERFMKRIGKWRQMEWSAAFARSMSDTFKEAMGR